MAITVWDDVTLNDVSKLILEILEYYPKKSEIYITSSIRSEPGSYHSGNLKYGGQPTAAVDIGFGGVAGQPSGRDVAKWLYENFWDLTVELIHTTPYSDDDGFYVKAQVRYPGGGPYAGVIAAQHADHVHFATSKTLAEAILNRLRSYNPAPPQPTGQKPMKGVDYSTSRPSPAGLKALGYDFVCRYLSWMPNPKVITLDELSKLQAVGLDVVLNWEYDAGDAKRGAPGGRVDSIEAVRQAITLGYPKGRTIYYSAGDYDVIGSRTLPTALQYCAEAKRITNDAGYRCGFYGNYHFLRELWNKGLIDDGWQSPSTFGIPGWERDSRNTLHQTHLDTTVLNSSVDINYSTTPVYFWNSVPAEITEKQITEEIMIIKPIGVSPVTNKERAAYYSTNGAGSIYWIQTPGELKDLQNALKTAGLYSEPIPVGSTRSFGVLVGPTPFIDIDGVHYEGDV